MAISEACQFEVKEEVDRLVKEKEITKTEAFVEMAAFYNEIGVPVKESTIKSKYHRATNKQEPEKAKARKAKREKAKAEMKVANATVVKSVDVGPIPKDMIVEIDHDANVSITPKPKSLPLIGDGYLRTPDDGSVYEFPKAILENLPLEPTEDNIYYLLNWCSEQVAKAKVEAKLEAEKNAPLEKLTPDELVERHEALVERDRELQDLLDELYDQRKKIQNVWLKKVCSFKKGDIVAVKEKKAVITDVYVGSDMKPEHISMYATTLTKKGVPSKQRGSDLYFHASNDLSQLKVVGHMAVG